MKMLSRFLWLAPLSMVVLATPFWGQDPGQVLRRLPALTPQDAAKAIRHAPGIRVELMAAEPLVASPVAMEWDETGALFVCEMRGYSEHREEKLSRIRRLVDTDGDGKPDKATLYVEGLLWPTALFPWDGGLFVADAPDILYFKDTDGDGIADKRETVFTGLGVSNVQGLVNSFRWHPEGRIHAAASSNGGTLMRPGNPGSAVALRGRDFSFDPKTRELRAETGGAQHGMGFDDWGRKFLCHNSDHAIYAWASDADLGRNPSYAAPSSKVSIAEDGPQAEVYRISPIEPWRILRTRMRVQGQAKGPIEGGGRAGGYFTSATGITVIRSDKVPKEMQEMLLVGDVGGNLIHRKKVDWEGAHPIARRIDPQSEWIASTDTWFRPAQFANGPDGAVWFLDVCREVIEHPASIPPEIKKQVDLDSGRDRGRLYRILAEGATPHPVANLARLQPGDWIALLEHPNAWHRETAARLLFAHSGEVTAPLAQLAHQSSQPQARAMALWVLKAKGALNPAHLQGALGDAHPRVRETAVRLARSFPEEASLTGTLVRLVGDPDGGVRLAAAFALGSRPGVDAAVFARLLAKEGSDPWIQAACLSASGVNRPQLARLLFEQFQEKPNATGQKTNPAIVPLLGAFLKDWSLTGAQVHEAGDAFARLPEPLAAGVLAAFAREWSASSKSLDSWLAAAGESARARFQGLVEKATRDLSDPSVESSIRATAVALLALRPDGATRKALTGTLIPREAPEVRAAAIRGLARIGGKETAKVFLDAWPGLTPSDRASAADFLVSNPIAVAVLVEAAQAKTFSLAELDPIHRTLLSQTRDPAMRARAVALLSAISQPQRAEVIARYQPALKRTGDPKKGAEVHAKACAACHRIGQVGSEIGPNLAAAANRGAESLLLNILDPNREVNPQFLAYVVTTTNGRTVTGMLLAESPTSVTLVKQGGEKETLLRSSIEEMKSTGKSLMPEGLEQQIDEQAMADLLAFLLKP